jgi:ribosomal protein S27E
MMSHLDGNALAGPLAEYFRFEPTTTTARCNGCGDVAPLGRAIVYNAAAGMVVRCSSCDAVLATIVESDDRVWLGFSGVSAIEITR